MNNSSHLESVSVIFIHKQQVFAVQRQPYLLDFPGYHAFPGGKINTDESSIAFETQFLCEHDALRMRALQREIMEELGYDIEEGIKKGEILSVSELAEALAPPFAPVRFRTWFYRVDLSKLIAFKVDSGEFANSFWKTSAELIETFRAGKSLMVHPTRLVLEGLQKHPQATAFGDLSQDFTDNETIPCLEILEGVTQYAVRSATLPPASRTNAFLLGDANAPTLLVDPSPNSVEEYQRLLNTVKVKKLDAIFLTHHHPDHHQFSNTLARQLKVPIILSQDTQQRLTLKNGEDYFEQIELQIVVEKEEVTRWHDSAVRVYEIPGHDSGHLGLAPDTMSWFIVGDLIQGIGTVVIPSPEGDMATYFKTLERVIALNPEVIIPSHGIPMRTTHRLIETLKHRRERESQILKLSKTGKSKQEILEKLYEGIDPCLHLLALQNIEAHLVKLCKEKQLIK